MRTACNTADLVVILRTLPVKDAIETLASKVVEDLTKIYPDSVIVLESHSAGFDIINK